VRGLHVFVTPEFRKWGVVPAEWFIDAAMAHLRRRYYVGLLAAAARHGAAHQASQVFQVIVDRQVPGRELGRLRLDFLVSERIERVPVETVNTPTGTMRISSPETTALDLVERAPDAGGLSHVATVLAELAERLDEKRLATAARLYPRAVAARLGHLLEHVAPKFPLDRLEKVVGDVDAPIAFDVRRPRRGPRDERWGLIVNAPIESDA
jgi:predicted transcriptional regulator of viral defense system